MGGFLQNGGKRRRFERHVPGDGTSSQRADHIASLPQSALGPVSPSLFRTWEEQAVPGRRGKGRVLRDVR